MGLKDIRGRRAPASRKVPARDGSVYAIPLTWFEERALPERYAYARALLAEPHDEEDPYACEVGGG